MLQKRKRLLKTSSEVELMETLQSSDALYYLPLLKTSSEVELMETTLSQSKGQFQVKRFVAVGISV